MWFGRFRLGSCGDGLHSWLLWLLGSNLCRRRWHALCNGLGVLGDHRRRGVLLSLHLMMRLLVGLWLNLALHRRMLRLMLDRNLGLLLNHVLLLRLLLLVVMLLTVVLVVRSALLVLLIVLFGRRIGRSGSYGSNSLYGRRLLNRLLILVVVLLIVVRLWLRLRRMLWLMLLRLYRCYLRCLRLRLLLLNLLLSLRLWIVLSRFCFQLLLRRTQRRNLLPLLDQRVGRSLLRRCIVVQHPLSDR